MTEESCPRLAPVNAAERRLLQYWDAGLPCILGAGALPDEALQQEEEAIRAEFLTSALLRCPPETGGELSGARITGVLTWASRRQNVPLRLNRCRFEAAPDLSRATLTHLRLSGCDLPGLKAPGLTVTDDLTFENCWFQSSCMLSHLSCAGRLDLSGSSFRGAEPDLPALCLARAEIGRDLIAKWLLTEGFCDLSGLQVRHETDLRGTVFRNARGPLALSLQSARPGERLIWQSVRVDRGAVSLAGAEVAVLADDAASWAACRDGLDLDGFRYGRIEGGPSGDLKGRIRWLTCGSVRAERFSPQPWRQFARLLRDSGDDAAARIVLMERERLCIRHERRRMRERMRHSLCGDGVTRRGPLRALRGAGAALAQLPAYAVHGLWSCMKRLGIGYGYDPKRPLYWSFALIGFGWALAHLGWQAGVFTPASDQILTSADWLSAMQADALRPTAAWLQTATAQHYEEFSPFLFALDSYLPVMDLGQERAWAVTTVTPEGWWGRVAWVALQAAGWIVTSLGIAAVAGLVQKARED